MLAALIASLFCSVSALCHLYGVKQGSYKQESRKMWRWTAANVHQLTTSRNNCWTILGALLISSTVTLLPWGGQWGVRNWNGLCWIDWTGTWSYQLFYSVRWFASVATALGDRLGPLGGSYRSTGTERLFQLFTWVDKRTNCDGL